MVYHGTDFEGQGGNPTVAEQNVVEQDRQRIARSALEDLAHRRQELKVGLAFGFCLLIGIHAREETLEVDPLELEKRAQSATASEVNRHVEHDKACGAV